VIVGATKYILSKEGKNERGERYLQIFLLGFVPMRKQIGVMP
jgi:hypothetical protein